MPFYDRKCPICGWTEYDVLEGVNATKDCPRCEAPTERVWTSKAANVNGDECDIVQENGFRHPTRFTSKSELRRALAEKGLEQQVRHVTIPGTDKSPYTTDWSKGCMDPVTLENARILTTRTGRASTPTRSGSESVGTWTIRVRE